MITENVGGTEIEFSYNGETLPLTAIMESKKITSLSILYQSKERRVSVGGFKGLLGVKKTVQEEKELAIEDPQGISLELDPGTETAKIRFWAKEGFDKLASNDYDEGTIRKTYIMTPVRPYQIYFHIGNLKAIAWQ